MIDNLMNLLQNAANPFTGFLREIWDVWRQDAGRAVLLARWYWEELPEEIVQQAFALQQQSAAAQSARQINDHVNLQLGALGISTSPGSGLPLGGGMNPDQAMFIMFMGMIRAQKGEFPAPPPLANLAEAVLKGQMDPLDAVSAAAPTVEQQQMINLLRVAGNPQFFRLMAVVQLAMALPRERIPIILPGVRQA